MQKAKCDLSKMEPINLYLHIINEDQKSFLQFLFDTHWYEFKKKLVSCLSKENYKIPETQKERVAQMLNEDAPTELINDILDKHINLLKEELTLHF